MFLKHTKAALNEMPVCPDDPGITIFTVPGTVKSMFYIMVPGNINVPLESEY